MTDEQLEELASLMVWGVGEPLVCDGRAYAPHEPLPAAAAADFMDIRRHRARVAMSHPVFRRLFATNLEAMRNGERARNVAVAAGIRDQIGEDSPSDRQVRLRAISVLEGPPAAQAAVSVNINSTTNNVSITPGYVIRLPAADAPALPQHADMPLVIEGTPVKEEDT